MEEQWSFGILLRGHRERRGWMVKEVAYLSGCVPSYLSHIEHGRRFPSMHRLARIVATLELNDDEMRELMMAYYKERRCN